MKSSRLKDTSSEVDEGVVEAKPSLWRRFKATVSQFKRDCREPLEGSGNLDRWGRVKARFLHLFKRYGWKLLVAIFVYYLIRDGLLYVVIPYLVAKKLFG